VSRLPPPTNYYGAKTRLAPWIASLLPPGRTYVEPFAGSAAVLFAKPPSPTEVLNDLDGAVVNFFRVLRERPGELARALRLTPYARAEHQQLAANYDDPELGEVERARRWFVRVNQSISHLAGRGRPSGWAAAFNTNGADHAHKFATLTNRLEACAERLRCVHLEHRPAVEVIAKYAKPAADAVVFCDPPYLAAVRSAGTARPGLDYAIEYSTEAEHRELAEVLWATPAAVLISGYPSALYADLYEARGWWRADRVVTRPTSNVSGGRGARAVEVVWSNRPLAAQARLLDQEATGP
jgi:DNA adenine methylase